MKIRNKYFPYPVIREHSEDFNKTTFDIEVISNSNEDNIVLTIKFLLNNEKIKELIEYKKAKFVIHLEESQTMFREVFEFSTTMGIVEIPKDKIRYKVELASFIVAYESIDNFESPDIDMIYNDVKISYDKYNIIGVSKSLEIIVNKENDEIKDVASIFIVTPIIEGEIFKVKLQKERIHIEMPEKDYKIYTELSHRYRYINNNDNFILMSLITIPIFVEVLHNIKEDIEGNENSLWFNPLVKAYQKKDIAILEEFKSNDFKAYELTQVIFDSVLSKAIERLNQGDKFDK